MSVPRPRAKKRVAVDEVVRTLAIYDWLIEGVRARTPRVSISEDAEVASIVAILAIAERIAARTEG